MEKLTIHQASAASGTASVGALVVHLEHAPPEKAQIEAFERAVRAAARGRERAAGGLYVIDPHTLPRPSEEVRSSISALLARIEPMVAAAALVLEVEGFGGAVLRGVATGIVFATRFRRPLKVFSTRADGIVWLSREMSKAGLEPSSVEDLTTTLEKVRAAMLSAE
jgi:hypothetical protein